MTVYTFDKTDKGIQGKAFEMAIKKALKRSNPDKVSPCGSADFRYNKKNYDTKQNSSVLKYSPDGKYIKGSSRVIYATHVDFEAVNETESTISITINLANTELFVLDRKEFVDFLLENGCAKENRKRGTVNIQTCYNYKKDCYHGKKGKIIEEWAYEHDIDDGIIGDIYEGLDE